jgi:fibronectin-binding autotransporter adhesin
VSAPGNIGSGNNVNLDSGTLLTTAGLNNPARSIQLNATGGTFDSGGFNSTFSQVINGPGTFTKTGNGNLTVSHFVGGGTLAINAGRVVITPTGGLSTGTSLVDALSITGSGQMDLGDNKLIHRGGAAASTWNGSAYAGTAGLVAAGYNGGLQNGIGLITTQSSAISPQVLTALVTMNATDAGYAGGTFSGQSVVAGDQLVMYSWGGDANMDGTLNGDDYFQIDSNVGLAGTVFGYHNGDFNYDGDINGDDYFIIDSNIGIGQSATPFPTSGGVGGLAVVPEPGSLGLCLLAAGALNTRRRTRKMFRRQ